MSVKNTLTITEARKKIFDLAERVQRPGAYFTLTENGRPKAVLLSVEEFDSMMETIEILSDPKIMADIKKSEEEYEKGEYITWEEMKKELHAADRPARVMAVADRGKKKYTVKKKAK